MTAPDPFFLFGNDTGILLIHGFTGSPAEMRPLGDYLHARGLTVSAPLLPGHGTTPADLNRRHWQDWLAHVEIALAELRTRCQRMFVAGLSLGALLTLTLASRHRDLAGIVTYSPAIIVNDPRARLVAILKYVTPTIAKPADYFGDPTAQALMWSYSVYPVAAAHETMKLIGEVRRRLPEVTCPLLVIYSRGDPTIHPRSARLVHDRVGSADKSLIALELSGHVITVDCEWQQVAEETVRFTQRARDSYL